MPAQTHDSGFADSVILDAQHDTLRHHESAELSKLWQRFAGVRIFFALLLAGLILFTGNSSGWLLLCLLAYSVWLLWNFAHLRRTTTVVHLPIDRLGHPGWRSVEVDLLFCSAILWLPQLLQYTQGQALPHPSLAGLGSLPPLWPLLLFSVVQAGIFGTRRIAEVTAALATLSLFTAHWIGAQLFTASNVRTGFAAVQNWLPLAEGLAGLICFAVALFAHLLADRLRTFELRSARARQQLHWQELMTDTLLEHSKVGVVVVARDLRLLACNPTALELLGLQPPHTAPQSPASAKKFDDAGSAEPAYTNNETPATLRTALNYGAHLGGRLSLWRNQLHAPAFAQLAELIPRHHDEAAEAHERRISSAPIELLAPSGRLVQVVHATPQTVGNYAFKEPCFTLTLQDLEAVKQRVQQEKLMSIGRLSAAVAHEIRNPLAAMTTANALLAEQLKTANAPQTSLDAAGFDTNLAQWRLLNDMVAKNAARLERTVRDILDGVHVEYTPRIETARVDGATENLAQQIPERPLNSSHNPHYIDEPVGNLAQWLHTEFNDWLQSNPEHSPAAGESGGRFKLRIAPQAQQAVAFDAEHLRRVLVNLLDNAARLSSYEAQAIVVSAGLKKGTQQLALTVWSHSPPMPAHIKQHLFEPLLSTSPQSSGLGLYLSYQLCQRYGATLTHREYERGSVLSSTSSHSVSHSRLGNEFALVFVPATATG